MLHNILGGFVNVLQGFTRGFKNNPKKCYIIFKWPLSCRIKIGLVTVSRAGLGLSKKNFWSKKFF